MIEGNRINKMGITSFVLHFIAMGFMLCDHLWATFLGKYEWLGYLGRIAFPMFAFMVAEGFVHTSNRKKYALRIFIFAIISEIPFNLMVSGRIINPFHQNVLWTFLISIGVLSLYKKIEANKHFLLRLLLYFIVTMGGYILGFISFVDYFGYGILMVEMFYFTRVACRSNGYQKVVRCLVQLFAMYYINCEMLEGMMFSISLFGMELEIYKQGIAIFSLPLIWLYNGKQGIYNQMIKNTYYWFYPVHMLIIGILVTIV